jgi:DNA-binding transcriptional regulator YhcF (GntR family)
MIDWQGNPIIDDSSSLPKYKQVVNLILDQIKDGTFRVGERIPSINETSEELLLSRDTVEKAYNELKEQAIIYSVRGKGYYISDRAADFKIKVLLVMNKLSLYKKEFYYSLIDALGNQAMVDLRIHHYDVHILDKMLQESIGKYSYYAILPYFLNSETEVKNVLQKIPADKLIILDKELPYLENLYSTIYQNFRKDIYNALVSALDLLSKYKVLKLIIPPEENIDQGIVVGFRNFCIHHKMDFQIIHSMRNLEVSYKDAFVVIKEENLVELIKNTQKMAFKLGEDVGIISYNESPLKELLCDGITVMSTNFRRMAQLAAECITNRNKVKIENPFTLIRRRSL